MNGLTDVEKRIFDTVTAKHVGPVDEPFLKKIIRLANTDGDGFKRVSLMGKSATYLVPIEDFILYGLKASDLGTKYVLQER